MYSHGILSNLLSLDFVVDCTWGDWQIGECACDTNEKEMVRKRNPELYGGAPCSGESNKTTPCLEEECVRKGILEKCIFEFPY